MPNERDITDLEGSVLGVVGVRGPCTPYAVRKEFQRSATPYWSGSAGAIYPVIERLSQRKLIKAVSTTDDGRAGKLYALTAKGKKVLKNWLYPAETSQLVGTPPDPLRTRIEFMEMLGPEKRKQFLIEVRSGLEEQLRKVKEKGDENDSSNYLEYLSVRGGIIAAEARLNWISEVEEILDKQK